MSRLRIKWRCYGEIGGEAKTHNGVLKGKESQGQNGWVYFPFERTKSVKREILTLLQQSESLEREEGWYRGSGEKCLRAFVFWPCFLL